MGKSEFGLDQGGKWSINDATTGFYLCYNFVLYDTGLEGVELESAYYCHLLYHFIRSSVRHIAFKILNKSFKNTQKNLRGLSIHVYAIRNRKKKKSSVLPLRQCTNIPSESEHDVVP